MEKLSNYFLNFAAITHSTTAAMQNRYLKNEKMLSRAENIALQSKAVVVVGCGGLGGYIIEMLARLGTGRITVIDGDVFDESNLNRQLLCTPENLGQPKALTALDRIRQVNPDVKAEAKQSYLTAENAIQLLQGHDLICDALDNIPSRKLLQETGEKLNIPMVYGAIAGWYAQVGTIFPGDRIFDMIYPEDTPKGIETELGNPSFTPALAASLQVAETLKVLLHKPGILQRKLLIANTLTMEFEYMEL